MAQGVNIFHNITQFFEHIPRAPEITDLVSLGDTSSLGQWLQAGFQIIACMIMEFSTISLFRYVLSGLQHVLPLTFSMSATQAVSFLTIDSDSSAS